MDAFHETSRVKGIGFSGAGRTTADIDGGHSAEGSEYHRGAGAPSAVAAMMVANPDTGHIADVPGAGGVEPAGDVHGAAR